MCREGDVEGALDRPAAKASTMLRNAKTLASAKDQLDERPPHTRSRAPR